MSVLKDTFDVSVSWTKQSLLAQAHFHDIVSIYQSRFDPVRLL